MVLQWNDPEKQQIIFHVIEKSCSRSSEWQFDIEDKLLGGRNKKYNGQWEELSLGQLELSICFMLLVFKNHLSQVI